MAQLDAGFARIVQGKCFGQVLLGEDLGFQAFGNLVVFLLEHDAAGDAGVRLAHRCHRRQGFPISLAVILLVDQVTVTRHQQTTVLTAAGCIVECPVELLKVHARCLTDLRGVLQGAPPAFGVRRRKVILRRCQAGEHEE
jgi:hypothetical protein